MKWLGRGVLALIILVGAAVGWYLYDAGDRLHAATPAALAALQSDSRVRVTEADWIEFRPAGQPPRGGLVFYPGGDCDERGYAEPLRGIAEAGFLVVLVPMPLKLAVLAPGAATDVMAAYPEIESWTIAGHSLGGSMAARFVARNPGAVDGLLLWDAYAPDDLSGRELPARLIHRANPAGAPPADYTPHLQNFPAGTDFVPLIGASHLNFGRFSAGRMYRDEPVPELPHAIQLREVVRASTEFLAELADT